MKIYNDSNITQYLMGYDQDPMSGEDVWPIFVRKVAPKDSILIFPREHMTQNVSNFFIGWSYDEGNEDRPECHTVIHVVNREQARLDHENGLKDREEEQNIINQRMTGHPLFVSAVRSPTSVVGSMGNG